MPFATPPWIAGAQMHARMWRALIAITLFLGAIGCCRESTHEPASVAPDVAAKIDAIVQSRMSAYLIPGAVVSVSDPKLGTYTKAYGFADEASKRPMTVGDHFRIGSVTKSFTATAVLQLADNGKLSLDDTLERYVAGIPHGNEITIRDLLGMRGGVYDYSADPAFQSHYFTDPPEPGWKAADALAIIKSHPDKASPPHTKTKYSNAGYYLLGLVIEKVTGKSAREVINDETGQLHLSGTSYPANADLPSPYSSGYKYVDNVRTDATATTGPDIFTTAGAMISTVPDLVRYAPMLAKGELLKPETSSARLQFTNLVENDPTVQYGLGIMKWGQWLGHQGDALGYATMVFYLPERDATVVIAVNRYDPGLNLPEAATWIWLAIVREFYPGSVPDSTADGQTDNLPPLPTADELDRELQQALDPSVPARDKKLKIADDAKDPELISLLANAFHKAGQRVHVDKVTDLGGGSAVATVTVTRPDGRGMPWVMQLVVRSGTWRISTGWACTIARLNAIASSACK
jgi:D-alanyl-D-alanine carboxypeptidase